MNTNTTNTTHSNHHHVGMRADLYADLRLVVDGYVSAFRQTEAAFNQGGFSSAWRTCPEIENRWKQWIREEEAKLGL